MMPAHYFFKNQATLDNIYLILSRSRVILNQRACGHWISFLALTHASTSQGGSNVYHLPDSESHVTFFGHLTIVKQFKMFFFEVYFI